MTPKKVDSKILTKKGHKFQIEVSPDRITFFEIMKKPLKDASGRILQDRILLGSASYDVGQQGTVLLLSGSITLDVRRYKGIGKPDIARLERNLVGEAEMIVFSRNPKIESVSGTIHDLARGINIEADTLFNPKRARLMLRKRTRFVKGKSPSNSGKRAVRRPGR